MRIGVLGPLQVDAKDPRLGTRDRVVLAALALRPGEVLSPEQLADAVWGAAPPASWPKNLQGCVSRLRKLLGADAIETSTQGYLLRAGGDSIDAVEFTQAAYRAKELLTLHESELARYVASRALELWRGRPLDDLEHWDAGIIEATRLAEVRSELEELVVEASLAAGRHGEVLSRAAAMVEAAPLRERRWALLARAQYQAGRQHEALGTVRRLRAILQQELGLDPGHELVSLEQAILRQDPGLLVDPVVDGHDDTSPYLGLTPYAESDSATFFGRDAEVRAGLERLRSARLLAVVGPSGSGKSSLVRAGLVPALRREGYDVRVLTPGRRPLDALTSTRAGHASLLVVDQAEEAFSLCPDEGERSAFFQALVEHADRGHVVLALRADHTGGLSRHPGLASLAERGLLLLGPMTPDALRAAIENPARRHGLLIEPGLVDLLVREVEGEPGALPLLSHTLRETWLRREGRTMTVQGYQASGGIRGAVAQSAEHLYTQAGDAERVQLRELVLRLVIPGPLGQPLRGRLPRHQVVVGVTQERLVDRLVAARLITSDDGVVELAHEALVRAWPRLQGWLEDDQAGQRLRHRLMQAAEDWSALGHQDSELYRGARLAAVREWVESGRPQLNDEEQRFLDASTALAIAEERSAVDLARARGRMIRRLRAALAGGAVLLALALVTSLVAVGQTRKADRSALTADADRIGAEALSTSDISRSLLMAVAGARLDPSPQTEQNLDTVLAERPQLVASVTVPARSPLSELTVSPDGQTLAVSDRSHHIWTYAAGSLDPVADTQIGTPLPSNLDTPLAFSPTGETLAVGAPPGRRGLVRLLDPGTLQPLHRQLGGWSGRWAEVDSVAYSGDGRSLAVSLTVPSGLEGSKSRSGEAVSDSGVVLVWDLTRPGHPARRIQLDPGDSNEVVALSRDGRVLYLSNSRSAYDVASGRWLLHRASGYSPAVAISPSGHLLGGTFGDSGSTAVSVVDTSMHRVMQDLTGATGNISQVSFSPNGTRLAAISDSGQALVWDLGYGDLIDTIDDGTPHASGLGWSSDGRALFTTASDSKEIHVWDLSGSRDFVPVVPIRHQPSGPVLWVSQHGTTVAVGQNVYPSDQDPDPAPNLWVVDVIGQTASSRLHTRHAWLGSVGSFRPDGRRFAAGYRDGWVQVFSAGRVRAGVQRPVWPGKTIETVDYTPNGRDLAVMDDEGDVRLLGAAGLRPEGPVVHLPGTRTWSLATGPDDREVFVFGGPPEYREGPDYPLTDRWWLVDLVSGTVLRQGSLDIRAETAAFSPRGGLVALGGHLGEVELLDLTTGRPVTPAVVGNKGESTGVAFDADGSRFATASGAGDVSLWDGRTGQPLGTTTLPEQGPNTVAGFRPDGTLTIAAGWGDVYRWDPSLAHAIAFACQAAGRDLTADEWHTYVGDRPRVAVCPNH